MKNYSDKEKALSIAAMHALLGLLECPNGPEITRQVLGTVAAVIEAAEPEPDECEAVLH